MQSKLERLEKDNFYLTKDIELKDQANSQREGHIQENIKLYKSTISELTHENKALREDVRHLSARNAEMEEEL